MRAAILLYLLPAVAFTQLIVPVVVDKHGNVLGVVSGPGVHRNAHRGPVLLKNSELHSTRENQGHRDSKKDVDYYSAAKEEGERASLRDEQALKKDTSADWVLADEYAAQDAKAVAAANAAGVKSHKLAAEREAGHALEKGYDRGYSDSGYRKVQGKIEFGRTTTFHDAARDAGIAGDAGRSEGRALDAATAEYSGAARAGAVRGGLKREGLLRDGLRSDSGLKVEREYSTGKYVRGNRRSDGDDRYGGHGHGDDGRGGYY